MGKEKRGPLALELWAKQLTDGYPGVSVRNMTTSWRSGLAFCALIHRFRPDLIDFDKLDPSDIIGNCTLAFEVAETKLGIPSLLDPVDMAALEIPDRLSILTYVAQFYNAFKSADMKPRMMPRRVGEVNENEAPQTQPTEKVDTPTSERKATNKRKTELDEDKIMDQVKRSMSNRSVLLSASSLCTECKNPVFISERVMFMKKLYHRSCFRCTHCNNPMNPHVVDTSPGGSLYCIEKACHSELLKKMEMSSASMNGSIDETTSTNVVPEFINSNETLNYANSSDNKPPLPEPESNSEKSAVVNNECSDVNSSIPTTDADNIIEDSKSQGDRDIQNQPDSKQDSPTPSHPGTPDKNRRIVEFAGDLLYSEEKTATSDPDLDNTTSTEKDNQDQKQETFPETEHSNEEVEEKQLSLKRTPELTSIPDQVDSTGEGESKGESDSKLLPSATEERSPPGSIPEPENQSSEIEKEEDLDTDQLQKEGEQPLTSTPKPKDEEDNSKDTNEEREHPVTVTPENPFEADDEEPVPSSLKTETTNSIPGNADSSPMPKKRPPKPPPPKLSLTPSPIPRSKTKDMDNSGSNSKDQDYYPAELNPFGSDDETSEKSSTLKKAEPKNPFEDDSEDELEGIQKPVPMPRSVSPRPEINNNANGSPMVSPKNAANFNIPPPRPPPPQLSHRKLPPPTKPYNPFEDDDDDEEERQSHSTSLGAEDTISISSKTSDLSSSISGIPTPTPRSLNTSDTEGTGSLKIRSRKNRRAPLPPNMSRDETNSAPSPVNSLSESCNTPPPRKVIPVQSNLLKGLNVSPQSPKTTTTGRKKRRAPPPRRRVEPLAEEAIKIEFTDLEVKLKELERQGIALETKIRTMMEEQEKAPKPDEAQVETEAKVSTTSEEHPTTDDGTNENDADPLDDMMIQLWNIVNEKNDILKRQTELEYLRRGHRLEQMQSELEFKLRVLMETPEDQRQSNHSRTEQESLQQLLKLVDERNEVVEWLDYHRQLEKEEEMLLSKSLTEFASATTKTVVDPIPETSKESKSKGKKSKSKDEKDKKEHGKLKLSLFRKKSKKVKAEGK